MKTLVLGRFPPPLDGQSLATERLADLLASDFEVLRVNTQPPQSGALQGGRNRFRRTAHFLGQRPRLKRALAEAPDAVVFWPAISPDPLGHFRDVLVTAPAFRPGQKTYAVVHRGNFHRMFERPYTALTARRLVERVDGFVFNANLLSERCARWIPRDKRFVIPNTIDDELIFHEDEVRKKQAERRSRKVLSVLFLSHMLRAKGYLDVLEAVILLREKGLELVAHFVGQWQHEKDWVEFLDRARKAGVSRAVFHHGVVMDRRAIRERYRQADVFALPTYYANEAQPHVLIEAMNAGIPVVATSHAGIPEMVRDEAEGLLIPARNPDAIAEAVGRLADFEFWQTISKRARRRFIETFAPAPVLERWKTLVESRPSAHSLASHLP